MSQENAITTTGSTLPANLAALATQYAPNAGMESVDMLDLKRPFYRILQPMSKELAPGTERYIQEARVGQFIEGAISNQLSSELKIVPLQVIKGYSEFKDQKQGGGFLGWHQENSERVTNSVESDWCTRITAEGTILKHTFQLFALIDPVASGRANIGIISFSGGALADVKRFLSYAMSLNVPMFFKEYTMTSYPKNNPNHNSTTFRPTFNVDKSVYVPEAVAKAAGDIHAKLDAAQLNLILNTSSDAPDLAPDTEVLDTVEASMN